MNDGQLRIDIGFPAERSIPSWESRHAAGEVPGRWPYGLDGLAAFADVRAVPLREPTTLDRVRSRLALPRRAVADAVGLTWDENAAFRMALVAPRSVRATGVIWLTDTAARGGDLGRMPDVLATMRALWVLSTAQVEPLRRLVPGVPVDYVRFGIDAEFFAAAPAPDRPRVVSVGGDRDRDTETLYRALSRVHAERPDVELIVQTSSSLPPPEGVQTLRHLPHAELRELYASASIVAIATRPNLHVSGMTVSLEAMATGRPVVETRSPGMDDYVVHGETGLLTEQGDDAALADGVLALLADEDRAQALGVASRERVASAFTSASMTRRIAEILGERV